MNTTQQRMTAVFNEWARRYAADPDEFGAILDADGNPVEGYGQCCALYFKKIADDMDAEGLLPKFQGSYDVLAASYGAEYRSAREVPSAKVSVATDTDQNPTAACEASRTAPVFSGMTNAELSHAIEAAWRMQRGTAPASASYSAIAAHIEALLEAQRMRASLMVLPAS